MADFLQALRSGRVLLMDGAMGTQLQRAGIAEDACYEEWNLSHPPQVRAIHKAYVAAGAEVLLTNTFQANSPAFAHHGLKLQLEPAIRAGVKLALEVTAPDRFAVGDIGPIDEPHSQQLRSMLDAFAGIDALIVETISDEALFLEVLGHTAIPVLVSFAFCRFSDGELHTRAHLTPESVAKQTCKCQSAVALGVNCGRDISMDDMIEVVRRYRTVTDRPLFARPNAGTPKRIGDRWVYPHTPAVMAARLPELLQAGVSMIGGCCGTTPEHIAAFRPIVDEWNARRGCTRARRR